MTEDKKALWDLDNQEQAQYLVNKLFLLNQTGVVNEIIKKIEFDDLDNYLKNVLKLKPERESDEDSDFESDLDLNDIYSWYLINPDFCNVIEACDLPLFRYKKSVWYGRTCGGQAMSLDGFVKDIMRYLNNQGWGLGYVAPVDNQEEKKTSSKYEELKNDEFNSFKKRKKKTDIKVVYVTPDNDSAIVLYVSSDRADRRAEYKILLDCNTIEDKIIGDINGNQLVVAMDGNGLFRNDIPNSSARKMFGNIEGLETMITGYYIIELNKGYSEDIMNLEVSLLDIKRAIISHFKKVR